MAGDSALFDYLSRRTVGGVPAADLALRSLAARDVWARRVYHPDEFLVEAINLAHCGLRVLRRRRHGVMVWSAGQPIEHVVSVRQGFARVLREEHRDADFYANVFAAAERWGPLPREFLAAFSVDSASAGGLQQRLWMAIRDRATTVDSASAGGLQQHLWMAIRDRATTLDTTGNCQLLLCPRPECRGCDRRI